MLFPRPLKEDYFSEKYILSKDYSQTSLTDFYKDVKAGCADIKLSSASLLSKEEFKIEINDEGIVLSASCNEGFFRACTSLLQLIKKQGRTLSYCEICDKPQFERRGYMLDISRGRMPKVESIKQMIDYLANLKYNEFQLYMEGDCFKISAFPEYTKDFDCLCADDIKEIDAYCKERFIDFVANQNSFGHCGPWLEKDEFRHLALCPEGEYGSTLNPLLPESLEFVDKLYSSLLPHYSTEYVNVGFDEAYELGKYQMEEYSNKHGKAVAFMEWLQKVAALAKDKYGKKIQFWSDMIYNNPETYKMIPKDAIALEWGYDLIQSQRMAEHCIGYQKEGIDYYICPSCNTQLSFVGRNDCSTFNIRTAAEVGAKYGARGLLLTDWGCGDGHPSFWVWSVVSIALAAQYGWNIGAEQDGESFKADFIRNAESYADEVVFGRRGVAELMYRMANYYFLEPERVHSGTMCGESFKMPINETCFGNIFELRDRGDKFYFENVTWYVKRVLADFEKMDFDEYLKREIIVNSKSIILASEICKVRLGEIPSNEEIDDLVNLADEIRKEFIILWNRRNFEKGIEDFLSQIDGRRAELIALKR